MASIRIKNDRDLVRKVTRIEKQEVRRVLDAFLAHLEITVKCVTAWSDKRSKVQPYISLDFPLDKPNDDFGSLVTETTERGVLNTTYTEKISCVVPQRITDLNIRLRNKNKFFYDDLISSKKLQLDTVFSSGYDEITWTVYNKDGSYAGTATIIMQMRRADTINHDPDGSTTLPEDSGYARYTGKTGDCFNCTKQ